MSNHNHTEACKHEKLKYCAKCDAVECLNEKCQVEWVKKQQSASNNLPYQFQVNDIPYCRSGLC